MTLVAAVPAKINLHLEVLGKRGDGYHELWTLYQSIDLADDLMVEAAPEGVVSLTVEPGGAVDPGAENLVVRAAEALRNHVGETRGASFHLCKRIPVGAGLGGGSADAAAALVLLDRLWDLRLPIEGLEALASSVGSDVPFFLHGGLAVGRGRGELVTPLPDLGRMGVLVGFPDTRISTPEAFSKLGPRLTCGRPDATVDAFAAGPREPGSGEPPWEKLLNDFEEVVTRSRPVIAGLVRAIRATGPLHASISGTGSAVFGVFRDAEAARRAARLVGNEWRVIVGSTLERRRAGLLHRRLEWLKEDASWK